MADKGVLLGKERFAGVLEMLKRMEEENVHRVKESLVDYTMSPAFDELLSIFASLAMFLN